MVNYIFDIIQPIIYNEVKSRVLYKVVIRMPLVTIRNYCSYVQMAGALHVILPSGYISGEPLKPSTLFLLAPEGEDGSRWLRHTGAERLAERYGIAMVLVDCQQGCYTDMAFGYRFAPVSAPRPSGAAAGGRESAGRGRVDGRHGRREMGARRAGTVRGGRLVFRAAG